MFDITDVIGEFRSLQSKFLQLKNALESNKSVSNKLYTEFYNSYHLATTLEHKIDTQTKQLNPLINRKSKRGIINGLGTIIKSITGNLDQNDAERYDKAIETLSDNQIKMKTLLKEQITLMQNSIQNYKENTQKLAHNQIVLQSRILQIESILERNDLHNIETHNYFLIQMVISQIITAYQVIYEVLENIEVAITFSKLNTFHNSIVEPNELLQEIKLISGKLTKHKLPFEPVLENVLLFEKTMEIKSYSKQNQIIFIIEIPIVEVENYNYYHLYSLPTPSIESFKIIIPQSKYLLLNEQSYMFFDTKCQEITSEEFICHETSPTKMEEKEAPCEVQMLKYVTNITNCQQVPVNIKKSKIQKVEKNKWIVVIPKKSVAVRKCGVNKDNIPVKGTFVLELNPDCEVQIEGVQIRSYQNPQNHFKNIELPQLSVENNPIVNSHTELEPLKLDAINLDEIKNVLSTLENQRKNINFISDSPVHFNNISVWTIIVYLFVIVIIAFALYYFYQKKVKRQNEDQKDQDTRLPNPVATPRISL